MGREYAEQYAILEAFRDRLIDRITEMTGDNCFVADEATAVIFPPSADVFMTCSIGAGTYAENMFAGGGEMQCVEDSSIVVTIFNRTQADQRNWAQDVLNDRNRGLIAKYKQNVLSAILKDSWEPADKDGPMLRDQISPASCTAPRLVVDSPESDLIYARIDISFNTSFDWRL